MTEEDKASSKSNKKFLGKWDFSDWSRETWFYVIVFLAVMALTVILGYLWTKNNEIFYSWIIRYFVKPIGQMGIWGMLLFLVFMGIQGILMPIPSEVVLLAAGIIWGFWGGFFMGMIGSMLAAIICYYIALKGGGPIVEKFLGKDKVEIMDVYVEKYGFAFVFTMRAIPFIGFDPISYVSGLLEMNFKKYFWANLLGTISRAFFYAWLGNQITNGDLDYILNMSEEELNEFISAGAGDFNRIIIIIIVTLLAFAALYNYVLLPYLKNRRDVELEKLSEEERKKLLEKEQSVSLINEAESGESEGEDNSS